MQVSLFITLLSTVVHLLDVISGMPGATPQMKAQANQMEQIAIQMTVEAVNSEASQTASAVPQVAPSCTLTATSGLNPTGVLVDSVSWSYTGSNDGELDTNYTGAENAGNTVYLQAAKLSGASGSQSSLKPATKFKATFGDATCYAELPQVATDASGHPLY